MSSRNYSFAFAPNIVGLCFNAESLENNDDFLQRLCGEVVGCNARGQNQPSVLSPEIFMEEFPSLFSNSLHIGNCNQYHVKLADTTPVRSSPFRCAPPKLRIFRQLVNELLEQAVIRPSKSPYASPAFLVPKSGGGFRMVVHYRKVNSTILFDSYPMPSVEQAFEQFSGAVIFSIFDLNSACFQIPLTASSRRVTAFCTPIGLFEFNGCPLALV